MVHRVYVRFLRMSTSNNDYAARMQHSLSKRQWRAEFSADLGCPPPFEWVHVKMPNRDSAASAVLSFNPIRWFSRDQDDLPHSDNSASAASLPAAEAVQAHLLALYKGRKPRHFATIHSADPGGPDPLTGVSVWQRVEPQAHWHYVSHGLSLPRGKVSGNPRDSGFGFELSLRLLAGRDEAEPPLWPLEFLHNLARYVYRTGNALENGHRMSANGPIAPGSNTQLCAMGFVDDPEVDALTSASGQIRFLQVVPLTADEEHAAERWDTRKLLAALLTRLPLWITPIQRGSMLGSPAIEAAVREGMARDGSSTGVLYTDVLDIALHKRMLRKPLLEITLGAQHMAKLSGLLPFRLAFGRPLVLSGPAWRLNFLPAEKNSFKVDGNAVTLYLTAAMVDAFGIVFQSGEGQQMLPDFEEITWHIKRTVIRNAQGDIVTVIA